MPESLVRCLLLPIHEQMWIRCLQRTPGVMGLQIMACTLAYVIFHMCVSTHKQFLVRVCLGEELLPNKFDRAVSTAECGYHHGDTRHVSTRVRRPPADCLDRHCTNLHKRSVCGRSVLYRALELQTVDSMMKRCYHDD